MKWLGEWYKRFWFATEFYLTPVDRRPYTFIFRDFMFTHVTATIVMIIAWYLGMGLLVLFNHPLIALILGCLSSFLLAHIVFGEKWLFGQQEDPQYLGG